MLALALLLGVIESLDKPARHTFVSEIVGNDHIANAVTLNNVIVNIGKVAGPAVAGILIATVGLAPSFLINAASFVAVLVGLALIRTDDLTRATPTPRARGQLREGLRYVRGRPDLLAPLVLMTVTGLLAYEWTVILPLLARDTFDGGADAAGLMFTAMGAGAIVGGLALAAVLKATTNRLVALGLVFAGTLVATAAAPSLTFALGCLVVVGAASVAFRTVASSVLQLRADPEMRGRVIALLMVAIGGTTPIGGPLVGWIGDRYGARTTLVVAAVGTAIAAYAALRYMRRRGRPSQTAEAAGTRAGRAGRPRLTGARLPYRWGYRADWAQKRAEAARRRPRVTGKLVGPSRLRALGAGQASPALVTAADRGVAGQRCSRTGRSCGCPRDDLPGLVCAVSRAICGPSCPLRWPCGPVRVAADRSPGSPPRPGPSASRGSVTCTSRPDRPKPTTAPSPATGRVTCSSAPATARRS